MKYLKYTMALVAMFAIFGIGNVAAKTYFYANIEIPALQGTWTSAQKEKRDEYSTQSFTNTASRDLLGNIYSMGGRTQAMYDPVGYSSWKYAAHDGGTASWGSQNKAMNYYKLHLKSQTYNMLSVSFTGSWQIDEQ